MPDCYIALGGNQGNVRETFSQALERLNQHPEIALIETSQWVETAPVGSQTDATFLNGAAHLSTSLSPEALLAELQAVETEMGRVREVRWSARTLDLDLLLYDQLILESAGLLIPHPAFWYRRFVLDPLTEIAADVLHPQKQITIKQLRQRLLKRPFVFSIAGLPPDEAAALIDGLKAQYPDVVFTCWELTEKVPQAEEPTLIAWLGAPYSAPNGDLLPVLPRLDLSGTGSFTEQIVHVLQSALDFQ
ncbi:2-amino-4-hydroxy-6-hydroxymethyldihydropteridine diphosphokinase [Gimesia fumaroli]|uniref:2-amino-4-hydroxy-6-hydroxymethyldihydropteridine pyrophosphokinase n=1 Tax=Gimesia fumaroli TaxID=2527976 RepID=A0A518IGU8_9PLAN|nr:2-amino-4-hydroxy-6-hydroxymethyldihydropteridine diphosphokinase [Gimesia fumaroli]QDV52319.1 2-amino-4-hydroxy-6-hydroxymethyldihydropteridine pyrophosphokinase [Gimesia fumaroli]